VLKVKIKARSDRSAGALIVLGDAVASAREAPQVKRAPDSPRMAEATVSNFERWRLQTTAAPVPPGMLALICGTVRRPPYERRTMFVNAGLSVCEGCLVERNS
jgi:hypothetical protein